MRPEYEQAKRAAKARGESPLGRSLGLDYPFIARWVAAHARDPRPMNVDEVTAAGGGAFPSKGAITMKYAVKEGLAVKHKASQPRWEPTAKAYELFPPGEAHVMPDPAEADVGGGTFTPMTKEEIEAAQREALPGEGPADHEALPPGEGE